MNLFIVVIRTLFFYVFVLFIYRIMGKREVGQLSILDLCVSILIAELIAISIENYSESIMLTIVPIILLTLLELLSAYLSLKCNKFRNIMSGKPVLLINRGIINYKEMIKQRYSLDDMLSSLRSKDIKNLKDVEYAVLENNGKLNIFKYKFLDKNNSPFPIILDGIIQKDTLEYMNKDEIWINNYLNENNLKKEEIFYAFYKNNKMYIIKRNQINS